MDLSFVLDQALDVVMGLLFLFIGYTTFKGYRRTRNPNLRTLSAIFLLAMTIGAPPQIWEIVSGKEWEYFDFFIRTLIIVVLVSLAWTLRWRPGWKTQLKLKKPE